MDDGLLDTTVFLHAQTSDEHSQECAHFLATLATGSIHARFDPLVLHELSYILPRYIKQMSHSDVGDYLLMVLDWPGVHADKDLLKDVVDRLSKTPGLAFVDAYLMALALDRNQPVFTKNVREFTRQGIDVPDPLPTADKAKYFDCGAVEQAVRPAYSTVMWRRHFSRPSPYTRFDDQCRISF